MKSGIFFGDFKNSAVGSPSFSVGALDAANLVMDSRWAIQAEVEKEISNRQGKDFLGLFDDFVFQQSV